VAEKLIFFSFSVNMLAYLASYAHILTLKSKLRMLTFSTIGGWFYHTLCRHLDGSRSSVRLVSGSCLYCRHDLKGIYRTFFTFYSGVKDQFAADDV